MQILWWRGGWFVGMAAREKNKNEDLGEWESRGKNEKGERKLRKIT